MAYSKLKWKISLGRGVLWMKSVHLEQHSVPFFEFCAYFVVGKKNCLISFADASFCAAKYVPAKKDDTVIIPHQNMCQQIF